MRSLSEVLRPTRHDTTLAKYLRNQINIHNHKALPNTAVRLFSGNYTVGQQEIQSNTEDINSLI